MKLKELLEHLERLDEFDRLSFAGSHDFSGARGQGLDRQPLSRLQNFPYDRDVSYGQPRAYDRGSPNHEPLHHMLTPKDTKHFSLSLLDLEEIIDEVMGSPILMSKGNTSNLGSSIPGSSGQWANNPAKDWDEPDEITDQPKEVDEGPLTIDPHPPDTEETPNYWLPHFRSETDDDMENRLNRIWGKDDNNNFKFGQPDFHVLGPDPFSVVNTRLSSRGLYGLMPKESTWDRVSSMVKKRKIE